MEPKLTVFTPTYNRAYCLPRGYEALKKQTNKKFKWLIVDDGSTDNTKELVNKWQQEDNGFEILYTYKENGGLHTGYNRAIELMDSDLCVCIDSDDFMPSNAVELIHSFWEKNGSSEYAGIVGLDYGMDGKAIGGLLPNIKSLFLRDLSIKHKYKGDLKVVYRTELLREVAPQPTFNNEKNFNPIYLMYKVDKILPLLVLNENLCFVEYQQGGMSNAIYKQFVNSPNSFAELRRLYMTMPNVPHSYIFKQCIHYVSSSVMSRNSKFIQQSPKKMMTILAIPFGLILAIYVFFKSKK